MSGQNISKLGAEIRYDYDDNQLKTMYETYTTVSVNNYTSCLYRNIANLPSKMALSEVYTSHTFEAEIRYA